MENNTIPWYAKRELWATVKEYFPWILCFVFIYFFKKSEEEKSQIYKDQIQEYNKYKDINNRLLDLTQKALDEKSVQNHTVEYNNSTNQRR